MAKILMTVIIIILSLELLAMVLRLFRDKTNFHSSISVSGYLRRYVMFSYKLEMMMLTFIIVSLVYISLAGL